MSSYAVKTKDGEGVNSEHSVKLHPRIDFLEMNLFLSRLHQ